MNIADILRHKASSGAGQVATIDATQTVTSLLEQLAERNIGAVLVTEDSDVKGIVSERDVVRRLARDGAAILDRPVAELMTTSVLSCTSGDSVDRIAATMTEKRIRHMPVIDGGRLTGIVSIGDVVSSRIRQLEQDRGQLEHYISG
jgi:CBS domain-containing protein